MKTIARWAISSLLLESLLAAAAAAGTAAAPAPVDDVLAGMEKAGAALKTYTADFTKERVFVIAEDREETGGKFFYAKPGKILWEFERPATRSVLIEPGQVTTFDPRIKQLQRLKLPQGKSEFQVIGFGTSKKAMTDTYVVELLGQDADAYHLNLIPRKIEESMFARFELWIDRKTFVPSTIKLYEKSTDETTITFTNAVINPAISSSRFKISPPPGTDIIE